MSRLGPALFLAIATAVVVFLVLVVGVSPVLAASSGVCEDAAVAASANLTCDVATDGADRLAVSMEAGCAGGVVPTMTVHRLGGGALLEPTSNPLALATAQTASRVCTSGMAALYSGFETYGWKDLRILARNNDTVARLVRVRWHSVVTAPPVQSVTIDGQPVDVDCVAGCEGGGGGTSSTVALSEGDASRLDLVWIGVFLMGGISLGMAVGAWLKRDGDRWAGA